jgi:hypothetical protein
VQLPTSDPEAAAASLPPVDSISAWQTLTGGAVGGRRPSLRSTVGGGGGEGKGGGEGVGERDARTVLHLSNQSAMTFFSESCCTLGFSFQLTYTKYFSLMFFFFFFKV